MVRGCVRAVTSPLRGARVPTAPAMRPRGPPSAGSMVAYSFGVGVGAGWAGVVGGGAVEGVGAVVEAVQEAGEPAVVPVGGGGQGGVGVGVGGLPGEPQRGELFDDLGVLAPA